MYLLMLRVEVRRCCEIAAVLNEACVRTYGKLSDIRLSNRCLVASRRKLRGLIPRCKLELQKQTELNHPYRTVG